MVAPTIVNAAKKKESTSQATPAPRKPYVQPVSESDPNKQQSTRDDGKNIDGSTIVSPSSSSSNSSNRSRVLHDIPSGLKSAVQRTIVTPARKVAEQIQFAKTHQEETFPDLQYGTPPMIAPASGAIQAIKATDATRAASKIGTVKDITSVASIAEGFATNSKTVAQTSSWLTKAAQVAGVSAAAGGALLTIVGSYPFAGFIKEEALQTLGFAVKGALDNNDFEGAEVAIEQQKEILNPSLWQEILAKVPFANVVANLKDFYAAAQTKLAVDEKVIADRKTQIDSGESDNDFYTRIADERAAQKEAERQSDADYYAEVERQRLAAKAAERKADEKYWADILAKREQDVAAKDNFDDDYWSEYYKTLQKSRDNSAPSNLKFGLL